MALIIDGYNLLHATGLVGRGIGPGGLERSRLALLNFVVASVDEADLGSTTVVFDARNAPPGLPTTLNFHGVTVRFATGYESADELIEELIRRDSSPRRLLVVSGDHRLQRAASHRRAKAIDSEAWYAAMLRRRAARSSQQKPTPIKPTSPTDGDVDFWLAQFADEPDSAALDADDIFPPGYGQDISE